MPNKPLHVTTTPPVTTTSFAQTGLVAKKRPLKQRLQTLIRWLHIYASLLGLMTVLFFGVTGLTLNHPHWFDSGYQADREASGLIDRRLIGAANEDPDTLEIVEFIRSTHNVRTAVSDFQSDDYQISVSFAGPGYTADVNIDRESAEYQFSEVQLGLTAVINDLHKGRDTGIVWSIFIDVSAVLLVFISVSGVLLLIWLKRLWRSGLLTIVAGTVAVAILTWLAVP